MLQVEIDETNGIAVLEPNGELSQGDFESAATIIDPFIESNGGLQGIIIHVDSFPGWDSFAALVAHLKFVKAHHTQVQKVAFATNSPIGPIASKIATHFVSAAIESFSFDELDSAKQWILDAN